MASFFLCHNARTVIDMERISTNHLTLQTNTCIRNTGLMIFGCITISAGLTVTASRQGRKNSACKNALVAKMYRNRTKIHMHVTI